MGKSTPKPPPTPDPRSIIAADAQANRVGQINPFGSATYQAGPNGGTNVVTELSPQMQQLMQRQFSLANTDSQRLEMPAELGAIGQGIGQRVGQRYGVNSSGNSGKPSMGGAMPPPSMQQGALGRPSAPAWGGQGPTTPDVLAQLQQALARRANSGGG